MRGAPARAARMRATWPPPWQCVDPKVARSTSVLYCRLMLLRRKKEKKKKKENERAQRRRRRRTSRTVYIGSARRRRRRYSSSCRRNTLLLSSAHTSAHTLSTHNAPDVSTHRRTRALFTRSVSGSGEPFSIPRLIVANLLRYSVYTCISCPI